MPSTKEIRQRIKGIKSTGKITRAMEMISAVKMRKAVAKVMDLRPYAKASLEVLAQISFVIQTEGLEYFQSRSVKNTLVVVITSNRGLCGSFNASVLRKLKQEIALLRDRYPEMDRVDFISVGKKGDQMLRRFNGEIKASFPEMVGDLSSTEEVRPLVRVIRDEYESERYDKVLLVYTDYISPLSQVAKIRNIVPLSQDILQDNLQEMSHFGTVAQEKKAAENGDASNQAEYVFKKKNAPYVIEPDPETVLKTLIPRMIEMQLYHALLESIASQEAARMMAMRNATDAAKDMVTDFTLSYNQLRQAKVTQEIAELSAGMSAVNE